MKHYHKDSKLQCPFCYKECAIASIDDTELITESDNAGTVRVPYSRIVKFVCGFCETRIEHVDYYQR